MQSYFSIISASIRPEIQEKISIGLVLIGKEGAFLDFSKTKMNVVKQLLPDLFYRGLNQEVKGIQNAFTKFIGNQYHPPLGEELINLFFSENYLSYLSRYKNSGLIFNPPEKIDIKSSQENFSRMYRQFVDERSFSLENFKQKQTFLTFKKEVLPTLKPYFNVNYEVNSEHFSRLLVPLRFDLVGKNDIAVFGKTIDLERRSDYIKNDLSNLLFLKDALPKSKRFLISKEPDKQYDKQHLIWENLRKTSQFEYVDVSEAQKIEDYAQSHKVLPLFKEEETE